MAGYNAAGHLSPKSFSPAPKPLPENTAATNFVVIDSRGFAVSCALTMNNSFGTGRIAAGTGIVLAAAPAKGGRGPVSLGPVIVANHNSRQFFFAGAANGGAVAATSLANVMARTLMADQKLDVAMGAARTHHGGAPDITYIEPNAAKGVASYLSQRGHRVATAPTLGRVNAAYCAGGLPRFADSCIVLTDPRGHGLSLSANE